MGAGLELITVSEIPQTQPSAGPCPIGTFVPQACRKCREGGGTQAPSNTGLSSPPSTYPFAPDAWQDDDGSDQCREEDGGNDGPGGVEGEASVGARVEGEGAIP